MIAQDRVLRSLSVLVVSASIGCATAAGPKSVQHVVTADQLAKEYSSSEMLFQEKYDGSYVQLTAKVSSVDKKKRVNNPDQPLVNLLTPSEHYEVYLTPQDTLQAATAGNVASATCVLSTDHAGWVRTLRNGYTVTVKGTLKVENSDVVGYHTSLEGCQPISIDARGEEGAPGLVPAAAREAASPVK